MKIWQYASYDEYVKLQTMYNKEKLDWVYVRESTIRQIKQHQPKASNILCHGTRNGAEQKYFKQYYPEAYIIGTEISDTASQFANTEQWDFSKPKEEWVGKFDIIYSNSFDHTICPEETLQVWRDQLSPTGKLYLEYSEKQAVYQDSDPLYATEDEVIKMLSMALLRIEDSWVAGINGGKVLICNVL